MRLVRACPLLAATCLSLACSSQQEPLPPELGGCSGDASCPPSSVGGGGGGSGDAAAAPDGASCGVVSSASQCDQCAAGQCCAGLVSCTSSSECNDLLMCIFNCPATKPDCVPGCKAMFPNAVQAYQGLESCLQVHCPICVESGVGDPCTPSSCVAGLTCQELGCTKPCTKDADCQGIGPNAGNFLGRNNVCLETSSGPKCVPGCSVTPDCSSYFPGTYCQSTLSVAGANVQVCAPIQDASSD